ncbi:MAG: Beta-galactosidase precursor [Lentisphaerae bacterium ADurb.Bin242]|nr:MAG: Beta-galactosidase precursor [Lentisphaerae bacterium ADurb.Bin242]
MLDGKEFQILSGAMHYFRIHPGYWHDRLTKLKQCGMNTVETYIAWVCHEEDEGTFAMDENHDFVKFIRIAQESGLHVIVRPGPYICSEVDLGGIPGWLLGKQGVRLRCLNEVYLKYADRYLDWVLGKLKKLQYPDGGPVIMMQIENEYGYYGNDREYMEHLCDRFLKNGISVPLFTSDGPGEIELKRGSVPGAVVTGNSKDCSEEQIRNMLAHQPEGPVVFMEIHQGAIQCWGSERQHNNPEKVRKVIGRLLKMKASINPYTFHGGTSFGFLAGGCFRENHYRPFCTSYDLDSALDETGAPTPKYFMFQEEIGRSSEKPAVHPRKAYGRIHLTRTVSLLEALPKMGIRHEEHLPRTMEEYGQTFGFIDYRIRLDGWKCASLELEGLQDRAIVLVNGVCAGSLWRNDVKFNAHLPGILWLQSPGDEFQVDIFVENMGRRIFGTAMNNELKGLKNIRVSGGEYCNLEVFRLPLKNGDIRKLEFSTGGIPTGQPAFYQGDFDIGEEPCDTFLHVPGGRGVCWINDFNLGRYWNIGPQQTLYVPAPVLRKGRNTLTVFELHGIPSRSVFFDDIHELGPAVSEQFYSGGE